MNLRAVGIVLLIAGVLVFFWAGFQLQDTNPWLPAIVVQQREQANQTYRLIQIAGGLVAIVGGVLVSLKRSGP